MQRQICLDEIRNQFPAALTCTYFDVAYDCGGALWSKAACEKYFSDWARAAAENQRGGPGRAAFFEHLDHGRELINTLIGGTGASQIAYTRNTNEGMNALIQGFDFQPGDNIVTDAGEHPSVLMPALNAKHTKGIEVRILPERADKKIPAEELIALADRHTRMICVSHVQSATGWCLDLKTLGSWCRAHGVFLLVDAIQSLGQKPFYAEEWGVDAVTASSYKGLCGVESTGFVYATKELLKHVWPVYTAAGFYMAKDGNEDVLICKDETHARKLENSSLDNLGGYIIHDSLEKLLAIGIDNIWSHINGLYHLLYSEIKAMGYEILSSENDDEHGSSLVLSGDGLEELFQFLRERNIALTFGHGLLRISVGVFNNEEDARILLKAMKDYKGL